MTVEAQPVKRAPGRPRKVPVERPGVVEEVPVEGSPLFEPDERVGQKVDDERWVSISFDDGRSYRVENGVIVERVG